MAGSTRYCTLKQFDTTKEIEEEATMLHAQFQSLDEVLQSYPQQTEAIVEITP
jgi:hypothetical protein